MTVFKVVFPVQIKKSTEFKSSNLSNFEQPNVVFAVSLFSEAYWPSTWHIILDSTLYEFDAGDISYIWEELPDLLQSCIDSNQASVTFYLVAQWRNTHIIVEPSSREEEVLVSIITKQHHPEYWNGTRPWEEGLVAQRYPIMKQNFLDEWKAFARKVVDELVKARLIDANDASIEEYFGRMPT